MHVAPKEADPQDMSHSIVKRWLSPADRAQRLLLDGNSGPITPIVAPDKSPRSTPSPTKKARLIHVKIVLELPTQP